ncbi:MAG: DUF4337 domain-containing protein [Thermodesulfovibrionales bacterium]|jgi:hypothetical protein
MPEVELPNTEELGEMREKTFTKRVALTTAIFAVLLAFTSLGGSHATKEMLLAQQQAADQWAFYQSKAVREHLYRLQKMRLETDLLERGSTMRPDVRKEYESKLKNMGDEEARYGAERKKIEREATALEHERDVHRRKDPYFEYGEVLLQIAIVMASISILSLSRPVFYVALLAAFGGTLAMLNGYLLIVRLPFFP